MTLENLQDLYVEKLQDLYSAEHQILHALPGMIKKANASELSQALQEHYTVTQYQVERLDQILNELGKSGKGKKCVGMSGILEEGKELLKEKADADVMDAGIIGAAQSVEHYEMAGYGTARTFAQTLGYNKAADLLQETLDEEGEADKTLTAIAESRVNREAMDKSNLKSRAVAR